MILLFILLGFQFELVNDWESNIFRWRVGIGEVELSRYNRDIEPLFLYLVGMFKAITFFGWLMLTAITYLGLIYYISRKYVPPKYYWIVIAVLMLRTDYALLMINFNRQCISVIFSIIAVLFLTEDFKIKALPLYKNILKTGIAAILIYAGTQCHSAAYTAFLIIPIYWFSQFYDGERWAIMASIFVTAYLERMYIDITFYRPT